MGDESRGEIAAEISVMGSLVLCGREKGDWELLVLLLCGKRGVNWCNMPLFCKLGQIVCIV